MDNISKIPFYLIHFTPLIERKKFLLKELKKYNITDITWITEKSISNYNFDSIYDNSEERFQKRLKTSFGNFGMKECPKLSRPEIEVTTQHIEALRLIEKRNIPNAIILEDDVVLCSNFLSKMSKYCKQLPKNFDVFYFGEGCGSLHYKRTVKEKILGIFYKKNVFFRSNRQSRYADSYMISRKGIQTMLPHLSSFQFPIDWETNYLHSTLNMEIYWAEPTLSHQGSASGKYKSGLR